MKNSFLKSLLERRVPHIIGSYIIAGSSLILFIDWLVVRYHFPSYYVTLLLFGILSIIPSVCILSYFHGAPGKDEWTKIEKIGIPINILFIALIGLIGYYNDYWVVSNQSADNKPRELENLYIAPIISDINFEEVKNIFPDNFDKDLPINELTYIGLDKKEKEDIYQSILSSSIPFLGDYFYYLTQDEMIELLGEKGLTPPKFNLDYDLALFNNYIKETPNDIWDVLLDNIDNSSIEFQIHTELKHMLYLNVIKIEPTFNGNNLLVIATIQHFEGKFEKNIEDFVKYNLLEDYEDYIIKTKDGYFSTTHWDSDQYFLLSNNKTFPIDLSGGLHQPLKEYVDRRNPGTDFNIIITSINDDNVVFSFTDSKKYIKVGSEFRISRYYSTDFGENYDNDGLNKRINDLEIFKQKIEEVPNSDDYNKFYDKTNNEWSNIELQKLYNGNHFLSKTHRSTWTNLFSTIKIIKIMDTTGIGTITEKNKYIDIRPNDDMKFKTY